MKVLRCDVVRPIPWCLIATLVFLIAAPSLVAQTLIIPADNGPRPGGGVNQNCPTGAPVKFQNILSPNCFDSAQPPSTPPQPPADGAGNVVASGGALTGFWFQSIPVFETVATVPELPPPGCKSPPSSTGIATCATIAGLGPSFNAESCFQCHSQPAVGGTSPGKITITTQSGPKTFISDAFTRFDKSENPEILAGEDLNATNSMPCFLQSGNNCVNIDHFTNGNFFNGPVVETRFINAVPADPVNHIDAVGAGGVGELFVFAGRSDLPATSTCKISQEDFQTQLSNKNITFRIPTPTFGVGFVENTPDPTLVHNASIAAGLATANYGGNLGITFGAFNRSGNDGTITRFGWKAQNKSLLMFSGEAANVEMGVTNELFPNEKTFGGDPANLNCINFNEYPEDQVLNTEQNVVTGDPSQISSVIQNDAIFMRLNGAPSQCNFNSPVGVCNNLTSGPLEGQCLFGQINTNVVCPSPTDLPKTGIGCVLCHFDRHTTGPSNAGTLSNAPFDPYSDFALHNMGTGDADNVTQGLAEGTQFRTAPLWGVGQRFFLLHNGRATNLLDAIQAHCATSDSEACAVVGKFNLLNATQKQDILDFLRSL